MTRPVLGVLAVVVEGTRVLLVQRGKEPDKGLWGYPGGHVENGETLEEAALRELDEETGIVARADGQLATFDLIRRDEAGAVTRHYVLVAVRCRHVSGDPVAADDAADARWVATADVFAHRLPMSANVDTLLARALDHDGKAGSR
ncbi:NUDIX hydrolase [Maritimibacter fusiformis]|uniref:NUDIX hydrolase n=1 Tax=Maritimibacter fusiformis TaxID=2603819 RepID=A0A5D0RLX3_9RHOB|nr:NUDIX hydrolase [Maritimibacter fusiformis]TYB81618.1 NUDIX hydrolase [Maritimibacter fusiformis]